MRIDSLVLVGENRFGASLELAEALGYLAAFDVPALVAAPARPHGYRLEPANEKLAGAADNYGDRVARLGRVDPWEGRAALAEAERCLTVLGCRGLFLHPAEEVFPVAQAMDLLAIATGHSAPVVISTGHYAQSEPLQVAELAARWPSLPIIMTSGGQTNISGLGMTEAWIALRRCRNLFVMTNGVYRQDFVESLVDEFSPKRVLWASSAPLFDLKFEHARIVSARMTASARDEVEGLNADRLLFAASERPWRYS